MIADFKSYKKDILHKKDIAHKKNMLNKKMLDKNGIKNKLNIRNTTKNKFKHKFKYTIYNNIKDDYSDYLNYSNMPNKNTKIQPYIKLDNQLLYECTINKLNKSKTVSKQISKQKQGSKQPANDNEINNEAKPAEQPELYELLDYNHIDFKFMCIDDYIVYELE